MVVGVRKGEKQQSLEKATADDPYNGTHAACDGASKLVLEVAKSMDPVIVSGDHVLQQIEILAPNNKEGYTHGLKEILLSLQKEIANCLHKLEMGWGDKVKGIQKGMKDWAQRLDKEDGPGPVQSKTTLDPVGKPTWTQPNNRYSKIYVRRRLPRRQLGWRPKSMGRMEQSAIEELPESSRR